MTIQRLLTGALLTTVLCSPAFADLTSVAKQVKPTLQYQEYYHAAGFEVAHYSGNVNSSNRVMGPGSTANDAHFSKPNDVSLSLFVEAGKIFDRLHLGVIARWNEGKLVNNANIDNIIPATNVSSIEKLNPNYSLAAKLGYLVTPWTLLYGEIGAAYSCYRSAVTFSTTQVSINETRKHSESIFGLLLGIGVEQYISRFISLNAGYRYVNYPDMKHTFRYTGSLSGFSVSRNVNISTNELHMGIAVHDIIGQANNWLTYII